MGAIISSLTGTLLAALVAVGLYILYRAILPKPLEGIPYNRDAADKLFGDVPEMMGYVLKTKRIFVSHPTIHPTQGTLSSTCKYLCSPNSPDSAGSRR